MKRNLLLVLAVIPFSLLAQGPQEQPALDAAAREALSQRALQDTVRARSAEANAEAGPSRDAGSTIVGERESPIGLYITPWRNAFSQQDIDRPPRLLEVNLEPVDPVVLGRQVEYYHALRDAKQGKAAPAKSESP